MDRNENYQQNEYNNQEYTRKKVYYEEIDPRTLTLTQHL